MSTAEWNVLGLLLCMAGVLMLFRFGLRTKAEPRHATMSWIALAAFIAGTLCQIWANVRWIG
jgi:NO-binding membrane sensor protein with MHYT domain